MEVDADIIQILKFSGDLHSLNEDTRAGGLQQLLIRKLKQRTPVKSEDMEESLSGIGNAQLSSLPVVVQLHILSYLDACDLCRMSAVNSYWNELCNDDILWAQMMNRDIITWKRIGHRTCPDIYEDVEGDWSMKQIYLKCCPETNRMMRDENYMFHQLSSLFRSILRPMFYQVPQKVIMFGPGLRKPTSQLFTNMITSSRFRVIGVAPSEFQGVGSGLYVSVDNSYTINLIVLYGGAKNVRDRLGVGSHKLFSPAYTGDIVSDSTEAGEWSATVRALGQTLHAAIFIINTQDWSRSCSERSNNVNLAKQQLFSMCRCMRDKAPVCVLSCAGDAASNSGEDAAVQLPCIHVCHLLQATQLHRPWLVSACQIDDVDSVCPPIHWLIEQSLR